jgi:hypothetical protein
MQMPFRRAPTLIVLMATFILLPSAASGMFNTEKLPAPDRKQAFYDNQCSSAAAAIITGTVDAETAKAIVDCNNHPDKESCLNTISFISTNAGAVPPELNCHASNRRDFLKPRVAPAAPRAVDRAKADADDGCAQAAATLVQGLKDPNLSKAIAACNKHPDKNECRNTRIFITQNRGKLPPDFTCQ